MAGWDNQKKRKLMFFILDPKLRKFEIKGRNDKIIRFVACQIMGDLSYYTCNYVTDKQNSTKICKYVVE